MKSSLIWLRVGGVSLLLLGIARGTGGGILLIHGAEALDTIQASATEITGVAWGLIIIGIIALVSGVGVLFRVKWFWLFGIIITVCFVLDGVLNGFLLFGAPQVRGTVGNIVVAAFILTALGLGRTALKVDTSHTN